ncbi:hypothetical protein [Endozoicomonas sp. ONNA2]|uniref:hypothetical protein n=1 Tax=Endozoicomonas sp. ONNA2 TaxID=2828741 RepID=UPI00214738CB|nr:hypothetical protein [Endozoicomonas sp. ONNA2]
MIKNIKNNKFVAIVVVSLFIGMLVLIPSSEEIPVPVKKFYYVDKDKSSGFIREISSLPSTRFFSFDSNAISIRGYNVLEENRGVREVYYLTHDEFYDIRSQLEYLRIKTVTDSQLEDLIDVLKIMKKEINNINNSTFSIPVDSCSEDVFKSTMPEFLLYRICMFKDQSKLYYARFYSEDIGRIIVVSDKQHVIKDKEGMAIEVKSVEEYLEKVLSEKQFFGLISSLEIRNENRDNFKSSLIRLHKENYNFIFRFFDDFFPLDS